VVTDERVRAFQIALLLGEPPPGFRPDETSIEVDAASIDASAHWSGDTSIWHMASGAVYRESALLRGRMKDAGIDREARLAHGVSAIMLALRTAYQQHPDAAIAGISRVRYSTPVFEGATMSAQVEPRTEAGSAFLVTTDQFQPNLAVTGAIEYGEITAFADPSFSSLAEQQLYGLEEAAGLVSATIALGVQAEGLRVLLMGEEVRLVEVTAIGDQLQSVVEIQTRSKSRMGEKIEATITVVRQNSGRATLVAWADVTCMTFPPEAGQQ
jgi:acyl dehydratase